LKTVHQKSVISPKQLEQLRQLLHEHLGLNFTNDKLKDLERCFFNFAVATNILNPAEYLTELLSSPPSREVVRKIAPYFTVGETYFMREQPVFDALRDRILPNLLFQRRKNNHLQIKIWSAGCSTGEEPYSIAILLKELIPDLQDWKITILGTDVNAMALQKAKSGIYTDWSFRRLDENIKKKYFRSIGKKTFEILPEIKSMVVFNELNLADLNFPTVHNGTYQCDIIMCRNVLYYFSETKRYQILDKLCLSLADEGWLINSPSESYTRFLTDLQAYFFPGAICYRKIDPTTKPKNVEPLIDRFIVLKTNNKPNLAQFSETKAHLNLRDTELFTQRKKTEIPKQSHLSRVKKISSAPGRQSSAPEQQSSEVLLRQAKLAADGGKYTEAEQLCEKVIASDPINAAAYYLSGVIQAEQSRLEPAVELIQKALFLDPNMVLAHIALGNLFAQLNKADKARLHFRNAQKLLQQLNEDMVFELSDMTAGELKTYLETIQTRVGA
jgi:chemotaxis protein methyltransferase CheR